MFESPSNWTLYWVSCLCHSHTLTLCKIILRRFIPMCFRQNTSCVRPIKHLIYCLWLFNKGCGQEVRNERASQPRRWRAHFLWRSVVFCMSSGTRVLRSKVSFFFFNSLYTLKMNTKIENPVTCEVRLVIWFLYFIRRKFAGRLVTWIVKVQRTKGCEVRVSVVRRRKDSARQYAATCTCSLLEQFKREIVDRSSHFPQFAQSDYHMFLHLKFLAGQRLRNDKETKGVAERLDGELFRRKA